MTTTIGPGQKAALFETLRKQFVLVGGTSILALGGTRITEDVDIVVTTETLNAFEETAALDSRFSRDAIHCWTYTCNTTEAKGILVRLEFLGMGAGFAPEIHAARPTLGGFRAGLAELTLMKAHTLDSRGEMKDRQDLRFLLGEMEMSDETFRDIEMDDEDLEILRDMVKSLGGRYSVLLESLLRCV